MNDDLQMYTIYHRPLDHPGTEFLVRAVTIRADAVVPGQVLGQATTLDGARLLVPLEADVCLDRDPTDPPTVVETWM